MSYGSLWTVGTLERGKQVSDESARSCNPRLLAWLLLIEQVVRKFFGLVQKSTTPSSSFGSRRPSKVPLGKLKHYRFQRLA
jgi:hypothetical protein